MCGDVTKAWMVSWFRGSGAAFFLPRNLFIVDYLEICILRWGYEKPALSVVTQSSWISGFVREVVRPRLNMIRLADLKSNQCRQVADINIALVVHGSIAIDPEDCFELWLSSWQERKRSRESLMVQAVLLKFGRESVKAVRRSSDTRKQT